MPEFRSCRRSTVVGQQASVHCLKMSYTVTSLVSFRLFFIPAPSCQNCVTLCVYLLSLPRFLRMWIEQVNSKRLSPNIFREVDLYFLCCHSQMICIWIGKNIDSLAIISYVNAMPELVSLYYIKPHTCSWYFFHDTGCLLTYRGMLDTRRDNCDPTVCIIFTKVFKATQIDLRSNPDLTYYLG